MCLIDTDRLSIREMEAERDLDFVAALLAHPEVMRYWPAPLTREEAIAWIDKQLGRYARNGFGYWLVSLKDSGAPIGQAGLMTIEIDDEPEVGLGYIIHVDHWGKGYATEAAAVCLDHGFRTLGLKCIVAPVRSDNAPSIRVAEKIGMSPRKTTSFAGFEHVIYMIDAPPKTGP